MADTERRRDVKEINNPNKGLKKNHRRNQRKNSKQKLREIDYSNPGSLDDYDEEIYE